MKHINVLIPASNIVAERELYQYIIQHNLDMSLHFARLDFRTPYGENQAKYTQELVDSIPKALRQLARINAEHTAVLCSSAELYYNGNDNLIFPLSSMGTELKYAGVKSPLVITPYNQSIGVQSVHELSKYHVNPSKTIHLDIKNKEKLFNYSVNKLADEIEKELALNADGICILCTNFATMHLAKQIESKFSLPFFSSNLVIMKQLSKQL